MEDPESIPVDDKMEDVRITPKKCSFALQFGCMLLTIIGCALSICVIFFGGPTNFRTSALDKLVDKKIDVVNENFTTGMILFLGCSIVGIFGTLRFIGAREMVATCLKMDVNKTFNFRRSCQTVCLFLIAVGIIGIMFGYPDLQACVVFISFDAVLFVVFLSIEFGESAYKNDIDAKEEKGLEKEEAQKSELFVIKKV